MRESKSEKERERESEQERMNSHRQHSLGLEEPLRKPLDLSWPDWTPLLGVWCEERGWANFFEMPLRYGKQ